MKRVLAHQSAAAEYSYRDSLISDDILPAEEPFSAHDDGYMLVTLFTP
jgi:hypothetical protein